jgi:hypothetical protein
MRRGLRLLSLLVAFTLFVAAAHAQSPSRESLARELEDVARVATVMVDGDVCQKIMTERALKKMFEINPEDQWAGSDNFDVNATPYILTKKTLMRLAKLLPYPVDCNLWMLFKEKPGQIQVLIRNQYEMSQFWTWGVLYQDTPPEMAEVLASGKPKTVLGKTGFVSILTPVYNSLGEIVGLVEVIGQAGQAGQGQ